MISLLIPNMSCGGCLRGVTAALRDVDANVRKVLADAGFAPA